MAAVDISEDLDQAPPALRQVGTHFGVEIDGAVVRVVTVHKGEIKESVELSGEEAFGAWAKKARTKNEMLIGFSGARTMTKVTDKFPMTEEPLYRSVLESLAEEAGGGIACARLGPPSAENSRYAAVSYVPESDADYAWRVAAVRRPVVVASSLVGLEDGLNLAIRNSNVELSVISHGEPQQVRLLNTSGLDQLATRFADIEGHSGAGHLADAFEGRPLRPEVADIISRHVADIAKEVTATVQFWKRSGAPFGTQLVVHGPGFRLPELQEQLSYGGLEPRLPGLPFGLEAPYIRPEDLVACHTALAAALSDPGNFVSFINRVVEQRRAKGRSRAKVGTILVGSLVGAVVLGGAVGYPLYTGHEELASAQRQMQAAEIAAEQATPVLQLGKYNEKGLGVWAKFAKTEPDWAKVDAYVMGSAPAGVKVTDFQVDDNGQTISVSLNASGGPVAFTSIETWLAELEADPLVSNLFSSQDQTQLSLSGKSQGTKFDIEFDLARSKFITPRLLPGAPTATTPKVTHG